MCKSRRGAAAGGHPERPGFFVPGIRVVELLVDNLDIGTLLFNPARAQDTGDGFAAAGENGDRHAFTAGQRRLDQPLVARVERQELAENQAVTGAGSVLACESALSSLFH